MMQRVAVVGPGGAGKSTFAGALGERLGCQVIHLDRYFWRPGWNAAPSEEWADTQRELVAAERWVVDGNYGGTFDVRFAGADTVVVFTPPRARCLVGAVSRTLRNYGRDARADGCPERFSLEFYRWIYNYDRDSRPRLEAAIARHPHLDVVELGSRAAAQRFVDSGDERS